MKIEFIADIGGNHNQDYSRAVKLIKSAAVMGCTAVKFQLFNAEHLYSPIRNPEKAKDLKNSELFLSWLPNLANVCKMLNIKFHCTPFSLNAVDHLSPYVDSLKIGSYEILWMNLIKHCASTGLPVSLSLGNATEEEADKAIRTLLAFHPRIDTITLYHCNSHYPAKPVDCKLKRIRELKKTYGIRIGWSDHTVSPGVLHRAVAEGARAIEFHLDLDGKGNEYKFGHCWKPKQIGKVIYDIREGLDASDPPYPHIILKDNIIDIDMWRTDPIDGQRPLKQYRTILTEK